eukprot:gnl/TRDRNA2_/TRDRNA2_169394_c0_seq3.p1 gnl/TRDRNA2_/TRDRNA2_169394_c0~~gnl/TRDRNA2_/TRDRNA2_169394_c0_seq3.p1  ORF type:complete len:404 (+),score=88.24 gnl/TRDRNA2_/TRDRNA2_169394_c0_seq3:129-1340(+)
MDFGSVIDAPENGRATAGNLEQILRNMSEHVGEEEAQIRGLRSLQMMLEFGSSQRLALCRAKGAEVLVAAMASHPQSAVLHCHATVVMAAFVQETPEVQVAATDAGAVEAIVATLSAAVAPGAAEAEELIASCTVALAAMCQSCAEATARICTCGAPAAVVAGMKRSEDALVQERGCEFFSLLACEGPNAATAIFESEGTLSVVAAMTACPAEADVQVAGCCALEGLAKAGIEEARLEVEIFQIGGVEAVVKAMCAHKSHADVQDRGCRALAALAAPSAALCERCLAAGAAEAAVAAVESAIASKKKSPAAARSGCHALGCLASGSEAARSLVVKASGARVIVEALKKWSQSAAMQVLSPEHLLVIHVVEAFGVAVEEVEFASRHSLKRFGVWPPSPWEHRRS